MENHPEIQRALNAGRKIEAIRLYRSATGASLREARDRINEMQQRLSPSGPLPQRQPGRWGPRLRFIGFTLLVLVALLVTIALWSARNAPLRP